MVISPYFAYQAGSSFSPFSYPLAGSSSYAPPQSVVQLQDVNVYNTLALKQLHGLLFPVRYTDSFFEQAKQAGELAKIVYVDNHAVGTICCRLEPEGPDHVGMYRIYIMTLGVLEPYRRRRLGHVLLQHILNEAQLRPYVTRVYLHCQVTNTAATAFYQQHGFEKVAYARDYYKHIPDKDAYVLVRNIMHHAS
ncbi:acyl-CoA N-acyltransferase [Gongronella butleri]|nr:acyl-CoA N-acyltransferase [Gongronella butleri]